MSEPIPKYFAGQKVRITTPLAKMKWGTISDAFRGEFADRSLAQKVTTPKYVVCYWVKCGPQKFVHGYFEHELEPLK